MYYLKNILVGYKMDVDNNQVYEIDVLYYSDKKIILDDDLKQDYHQYDVLKVYQEDDVLNKIKEKIDFLESHNKNYTKQQYNLICDIQDLLK